ncbi:hypothetical protein ACFL6D_04260 [Spirochaetota bacterium]
MIIAFIGFDGTGKTTTALELVKQLKKRGKKILYWEEFEYLLLKYILKLFKKQVKKHRNDFFDVKKKKIHVMYIIWQYFILIDSLLTYIYHRALSLFGYAVVCDRYHYDYIIPGEELRYIAPFLKKLFLLLPRPDVGIMMDIPADTAFERKKLIDPYPQSWFRNRRKMYIELNKKIKFTVVNSTNTLSKNINSILRIIDSK